MIRSGVPERDREAKSVSNLPALLADYGAYHRDPRNRLTHYFGVPAIARSEEHTSELQSP